MIKVGSLESSPVVRYDWVIKDFLKCVAEASPPRNCWKSPVFVVKDLIFRLVCKTNQTPYPDRVSFLLANPSQQPLSIALFSLHLVSSDGSLKKVCLKKDVAFGMNNIYLGQSHRRTAVPDGFISSTDLDLKFLPNGELRFRCHLEIKSQEPAVTGAGTDDVDETFPDPPLMKDLSNEVGTHQFSDFTLVCGEREFPVYRLLLAARSPIFRAMFENGDWKEAKTGRAVIEDVKPETLEALIKFAHTDKVSDEDLTTDLLSLADKYQISVLVEKCEAQLIKSLTSDNAADYFLLAYLHQANKLKDAAKKFIVDNFQFVEKKKGIDFIVEHHPKALYEILQSACKN